MAGDDATRRDTAWEKFWAEYGTHWDLTASDYVRTHAFDPIWTACSAALRGDAELARARREGVAAEHEAMLWEIVEIGAELLDLSEARFSLREACDLIVKAIRERDRASSEPRP